MRDISFLNSYEPWICLGTLRTASATYRQDWDDELQPTKSGFTTLADGPWLTHPDALGSTRASVDLRREGIV